MEQQNHQLPQQINKTQSAISNSFSKTQVQTALVISNNIYFFGFNGDKSVIERMTAKIIDLFEPFDPEILNSVFDDFAIGKLEYKYQFGLVEICRGIKSKGILTKQERSDKEQIDEFQKDFNDLERHLVK